MAISSGCERCGALKPLVRSFSRPFFGSAQYDDFQARHLGPYLLCEPCREASGLLTEAEHAEAWARLDERARVVDAVQRREAVAGTLRAERRLLAERSLYPRRETCMRCHRALLPDAPEHALCARCQVRPCWTWILPEGEHRGGFVVRLGRWVGFSVDWYYFQPQYRAVWGVQRHSLALGRWWIQWGAWRRNV